MEMFSNNQQNNTTVTESSPKENAEIHTICISNNYNLFRSAIEVNNIETVIESINKGADVNHPGINTSTPLHVAAHYGHQKIIELLIKNGGFVDATILTGKDRGFTPLYFAVQNNNLECVKILLQKGASVSPKIEGICHPIHLAVFNNYPEIVELLVQNGADVNQRFSNEFFEEYKPNMHRSLWFNHKLPLIHYVILQNFDEIFDILDHYNADINSKTSYGRTALMHAVETNNKMWVYTLLAEKNADANARDIFGQPVIHFIVINANRIESTYNLEHDTFRSDKIGILEILMNFGVDINVRFPEDCAHGAVINYMIMLGFSAAVFTLLEYGVELNFNDIDLKSLYLARIFPENLTSEIKNNNNALRALEDGFLDAVYGIMMKAMSLKTIGHPVNEDVILKEPIHQSVSMEDFTDQLYMMEFQIGREIRFMKKYTIDCNITFWDLLTCDLNEIVKLITRKPFTDCSAFIDIYTEVSFYYAVMEKRLRDARKRKLFLEESTELISSLLIYDLPYDCCKKITNFLTEKDIIFC